MTKFVRSGETLSNKTSAKPQKKALSVRDFRPDDVLVTGEFIKTKLVASKEYKNKDGTPKQFKIHEFKNLDGEDVDVWGCAALDRLLEKVDSGTPVEIVYLGKIKKKAKDGNPYTEHAFELHKGELA